MTTVSVTRRALRAFEARSGSYLPCARLAPPAGGPRLIERSRLNASFELGRRTPVTIVQAPTGYGKTSLLTQWFSSLRGTPTVAAWLTLDAQTQTPDTFVAHVIAALTEAGCKTDTAIREWLSGHGPCSTDTIVRRISDRRDETDLPVVLFLDDVHHLTGAAPAASLRALVESASSRFCIVISSRGQPDVRAARLRALGRVTEIDERELAFTAHEIRELLEYLAYPSITDAQIELIGRHTEGWPWAVTLFSRDSQVAPGAAQGDRYDALSAYFAEEVFNLQSAEVQRFLVESSILERCHAGLCDAVTGRNDSVQLLQLCRRNGVPLQASDTCGWFRYQNLFRVFLRERVRMLPDAERVTLHERASLWLAEHDQPLDGCVHAMHAGDVERAARLLDESSEALFGSWQLPRVPELAARLPDGVREQYPRLMLAAACQLIVEWRFDEAEALLRAARERIAELARHKNITAKQLHLMEGTLLHREAILAQFRDEPRVAEALCEKLLSEHADTPSYLKGRFYSVLMNARRLQFRLADIDRLDALAQQHNRKAGNPLVSLVHDCITGIALHATGRTDAAIWRLRGALDVAEHIEGPRGEQGAIAALLLAEIHYARNDLESARRLVADYLPAAPNSGNNEKFIRGWLTHARLAHLDFGPDAALAALEEAEIIANRRAFQRMRVTIGAERMKILFQYGRRREAEDIARELGVNRMSAAMESARNPTLCDEARALAWTRLALARNDLSGASRVARQWRSRLASSGATPHVVQWQLLIAQSLILQGQMGAATRVVREALVTASASGLIRLFLDEGRGIAVIVSSCAQVRSARHGADLLACKIAACLPREEIDVLGAHISSTPVIHLTEALSQTEINALAMVGQGLRNCEVALRLGITEGSVKWCLQQVYDKIGVRKRSHAVHHARRLGLIS